MFILSFMTEFIVPPEKSPRTKRQRVTEVFQNETVQRGLFSVATLLGLAATLIAVEAFGAGMDKMILGVLGSLLLATFALKPL